DHDNTAPHPRHLSKGLQVLSVEVPSISDPVLPLPIQRGPVPEPMVVPPAPNLAPVSGPERLLSVP
ncbi:hypothetical protein KI387_004230, partial [Taxus chinensis]